ncbi:MAG: glycoside hydrolase family 2 protein, partial [Anaerolineales bacterium]|nr:glycoside hydrolase family 2 protein [Anaerolineales bacterium]
MTGVSHAIPGGPYLRKAPCQFGWDWGPKLPPIGIWQAIRLEGRSVARFDDVRLMQQHQDGAVVLEAAVSLDRWQADDLTVMMHITGPDDRTITTKAALDGNSHTLAVTIDQPQLWWPNGYGDQPLYQVDLHLTDGKHVVDQRHY